jgi:Tol biopolymer transport system component
MVRYDLAARQWLQYFSGISAEFLTYSPDGNRVTYVDYPDGALWRSSIDGSDKLKLAGPPMQTVHPSWSPDGRRIAFMGMVPGRPRQVYVVSAEGGTPEPVLPERHHQEQPSWSPDGHSLLVSYVYFLEPEPQGIKIVDLRTREAKPLPGSEGLWEGSWSPDGRHIAARTIDSRAIRLFDVHAQKWTELARSDVGCLCWSKDGRFVYFKRLGSRSAVMRVRVEDHKVEQVVSLTNIRYTGFARGIWIGLTPDNSPLMLRDTGTEEIYALDWQAP